MPWSHKTLPCERLFFWAFICFALVGCQGAPLNLAITKPFGPTGAALQQLLSRSSDPVPVSREFEYLQVEFKSAKVLLALGLRTRDANNAVVEHWYSGQSERLEIRDGRIWRLSGAITEWRGQVASPPPWSALADGTRVTWQRQLDVMPNYRYGQIDHVSSQRLPGGPTSAKQALDLSSQSQQLLWFSDTITSRDESGRPWVFDQVFAIEPGSTYPDGRWIYSEQCVSPLMCMKLRYLGFVK